MSTQDTLLVLYQAKIALTPRISTPPAAYAARSQTHLQRIHQDIYILSRYPFLYPTHLTSTFFFPLQNSSLPQLSPDPFPHFPQPSNPPHSPRTRRARYCPSNSSCSPEPDHTAQIIPPQRRHRISTPRTDPAQLHSCHPCGPARTWGRYTPPGRQTGRGRDGGRR